MPAIAVPATDFARGLSDYLNQVQYRGQVLDISRGKKIIARVVPAGYQDGFPIAQLDAFLANLPPLDPEDRALFAKDLDDIRQQMNQPVRDAWGAEE